MFIPPTPSWHELALLALACWAATAAHEVRAEEMPAKPGVGAVRVIVQPMTPSQTEKPLALGLAGLLTAATLVRRRGQRDDH